MAPSTGKGRPLTDLPLFASDAELGAAIMPRGREREWPKIAESLEKLGLPKIDPTFKARYWPAVRAFLDHRAGLREALPHPDMDERERWDDIFMQRSPPAKRARR